MYIHHDKHNLWNSTAAVFGGSHIYSRKGEQKELSMLRSMPKTLPTIAISAGRRALSGDWVLPALLFCIMGVAMGFAVWLML
jgi:hypothetical protein